MHNDARQRMVVLGLDGLPLALARDLCAAGRTPHLARIVHAPGTRTIDAELPELSPVNWTSFYTAAGPEEHGVFGFTRINAATYALSLADFTQVTLPTIFDRLGERGLTSRVVNLPNTYPARPIPGMLVSGFVAHELARAVHPPFLLGPLTGAGYRLEADTSRGGGDPAHLLAELCATLQARRAALRLLWPDLSWDLFVFVLTETDRLFHFLWNAVTDATHPLHTACMDLLASWDDVLGEVLDLTAALPGGARLMVLADHGFTGLVTEVDVNAWLRAEGHLRLSPAACGESPPLRGGGAGCPSGPSGMSGIPGIPGISGLSGPVGLSGMSCEPGVSGTRLMSAGQPPHDTLPSSPGGGLFFGPATRPVVETAQELDATRIQPESAAFALDPGRIYLHTRRRFAKGTLSDGEAAALAARLREGLLRLTHEGHPVLREVLTADELYDGPMRGVAPDLVCIPHEGFDLKAKFNRTAVFGHFGRTGTHSAAGAIFHDSEGARPVRLRDAGALVLEHFGLAPQRAPHEGRTLFTATQGVPIAPPIIVK